MALNQMQNLKINSCRMMTNTNQSKMEWKMLLWKRQMKQGRKEKQRKATRHTANSEKMLST
eukprot:3927671-Ditylum_brightwellii.AAC.1